LEVGTLQRSTFNVQPFNFQPSTFRPFDHSTFTMPELPDLTVYIEALRARVLGRQVSGVRLASPFLLRTVDPPLSSVAGATVRDLRRLGKRIVVGLEDELFLVVHLMIAGRLRWRETGAAIPKKIGLAAFDFTSGTAILTEAGTKRRASLHVVRGEPALRALDPGGLEILEATAMDLGRALTHENHTLKRALTDPQVVSGVGNAYSDEILHRARLSPFQLTRSLSEADVARLHEAARDVLTSWTDRLRAEARDAFPERVTAFREGMAVHGRYGRPCPACGTPVQRVAYAENEANYCAACQTGGRLLRDRALSRLLRDDWPRTLAELEQSKGRRVEEFKSSRVEEFKSRTSEPASRGEPASPSTPDSPGPSAAAGSQTAASVSPAERVGSRRAGSASAVRFGRSRRRPRK
jgi:formamidopyrimidine-DNA glycosylase